jgi:serine/threonine-protein kinase HipA
MTSEIRDEAFVWVWLPGAVDPVVAGRLARSGDTLIFNYGRSYLDRTDAIPLYLPELPLRAGAIPPIPGLAIAGCLRDAAPDAWGRRVILNRMFGGAGGELDPARLDELTYLLESGSDRTGALDFQTSATDYTPRPLQTATIEELQDAALRVEAGIPLTPALQQALLHGTSLGGARPKAMIRMDGDTWIAKFSASTDTFNLVKAEFVAMRLARLAGLDVADVRLQRSAGKDVLLVRRFDRGAAGTGHRRLMVSALTMLGLDEMMARYASYQDLAEIVRHRFAEPIPALRELYARLVFNVLCGNTDDHARNHSAFWDGQGLAMTPAYDICPQARAGNEAAQAMLIVDQRRGSNLALCMEAARHFLLGEAEATDLIRGQLDVMQHRFDEACDEAALDEVNRNMLRRRQFLNPSIFDGAPETLRH